MKNNSQLPNIYAGIEAGGTKFNCVVGTDPSNIIERAKFPTTTPEETFGLVQEFLAAKVSEHGKLAAMGIACFGPLDLRRDSGRYGHITATPKQYWSNTDVVGYFRNAFDIPIGFDTDVNGSALGEYLYGAAQGVDDFVYVTIGTGIGAGVFANGAPVNGLIHTEIGHLLVPRDHKLDPFEGLCPFHEDCLTDLACGPAIEARWQQPAHELPEDHAAWKLEAHYLAVMCVNITLSYSPRLIILGGGVMGQLHLYPMIREKFSALMNGFMMPEISLDQYIVPPWLPASCGEVGALALAMRSDPSAAAP